MTIGTSSHSPAPVRQYLPTFIVFHRRQRGFREFSSCSSGSQHLRLNISSLYASETVNINLGQALSFELRTIVLLGQEGKTTPLSAKLGRSVRDTGPFFPTRDFVVVVVLVERFDWSQCFRTRTLYLFARACRNISLGNAKNHGAKPKQPNQLTTFSGTTYLTVHTLCYCRY